MLNILSPDKPCFESIYPRKPEWSILILSEFRSIKSYISIVTKHIISKLFIISVSVSIFFKHGLQRYDSGYVMKVEDVLRVFAIRK